MKTQLKRLVGSVLHHLAPGLTSEVQEGKIDGKHGKLKRLISDYLTSQAAASGDLPSLRNQLANYWQSSRGDAFYDAYPERFEKWFLGEHYSVVEALAKQLESQPAIKRIIEVGCGDGKVLEHLVGKFPQLASATGIDINEPIIERNRTLYDATNLKFESADLHSWLQKYHGSGILLVSYGGVLEYLTQAELEEVFTTFKNMAAPVMIMLVEPIARDFDLENETVSRPHGIENSFSHPHRHLLEKAGWKIEFEEVKKMEHRWMLMIASA